MNLGTPPRIGPKEAPPFLASKWLHLDLLVNQALMQKLMLSLEQKNLFLFSNHGVQPRGKNLLSVTQFLDAWGRYLFSLQSGKPVIDSEFSFFFTAIMTVTPEAVRALDIPGEREIIIPYEPVVQMQIHRFDYSEVDGQFRSMVFGPQSISWGIRLSYPQLFQYSQTRVVEEALDETRFPNATLFSDIKQWVRQNTLPTPFVVQQQRVNVPIRIDKESLTWINCHPELGKKKLQVLTCI